ncbi:MAG: hypothetical protein ACYTF1_04675 [Planctomycetota bacterium]|jgi:hypothetical protein
MRKKNYLIGSAVFVTVLSICLANPASAAVTTISDAFTDDLGGSRDNGDSLDGVTVQVGGQTWEANNMAFVQPDGVVTSTLKDGVRAFVPLAEEDYPVGTTFSVKVDARFEVIADKPIRFVQIGLVDEEVTNYSFGAGNRAISFILYFNQAWSLRADGVSIADQNHPDAQPLNSFSTTGWTGIELIYNSMKNTVKVLVNGSSVLKHDAVTGRNYNLNPLFPDPGMAGFNCSAQVRNVVAGTFEDAPAGAVQFDNFDAKANDSTALWIEDGPLVNPANGRIYYLLSPSSWGAAEAMGRRLGGHLVTINDQSEHDWIFNTWGSYDTTAVNTALGILPCGSGQGICELCDISTPDRVDGLWIGYSQPYPVDPANEPDLGWVWADGASPPYSNWAAGHPSNTTNCAETGQQANYGVLVGPDFNATGQWWAYNGDTTVTIMGVVEVRQAQALAYYGDVVPSDANSLVDIFGTRHGQFVKKHGDTALGSLVSDPDAIDGSAYRIDDNRPGSTQATDTLKWVSRSGPGINDILNFFRETGTTLVARIKVPTFSGDGANLYIEDRGSVNKHTTRLRVDGQNGSLTDIIRNHQASVTGLDDGQYHIIRIAVGRPAGEPTHDRTLNIYVDENPTPTISVTPASDVQSGDTKDGWGFGPDGLAGATQDLYVDWLAGYEAPDSNVAGVIPPGISHVLNDLVDQLMDPNCQRCGLSVTPKGAQLTTLAEGSTADFEYMVTNSGISPVGYTVQESDVAGTLHDYTWLSLDKTSGSLPTGNATDTVTATADAAGLSITSHTAYLKFTNDCNPPTSFIREITIDVKECLWDISGGITAWGCLNPKQYSFTVTNLGNTAGNDLSYTVEEVDSNDPQTAQPTDWPWLSLDKTSGGPVVPGSTDTLTVTVDSPNSVNLGWVRFTPSPACAGRDVLIREVNVRHTPPANQLQDGYAVFEYHGDQDPTAYGSCGFDCTFIKPGTDNLFQGSVDNDPDAVDDKAWRIVDTVNDDGMNTIFRSDAGLGAGLINLNDGWLGSTLLARIRVRSNANAGGMLFINEAISPSAGTYLALGWGGAGPSLAGKVREFTRDATSGLTTPGSTSDYVLIRITAGFGPFGGRTINLYVNEDPAPVLTIENAEGINPHQHGDGYGFGVRGRQGTGDISWDYIVWTNAGMYGPGQEDYCLEDPHNPGELLGSLDPVGACCTLAGCVDTIEDYCVNTLGGFFKGRGLKCNETTCCPNPFADTDEDGDVDQDDFASFQICYTGSGGGVPLNCECFNRDSDNDIDHEDYVKFQDCAGGPNIPATPASNPACAFN